MFASTTATGTRLDEQLLEGFLRAGSEWVLYVLIALSFVAVAIILERIVFYLLERGRRIELEAALRELTRGGSPAGAAKRLRGLRSLPVAVARTCLEHAADGAASVEEHAASSVGTERLRYERGLAFLGTLGNNAPFIGLFGTVLGIIRSFHDLSINSAAGSEAVMAGIAEALVATAVGLVVALPAVAAFNYCTRHVERTITAADSATHRILAYIRAEPSDGQEQPAEGV